MTDHTTPAADIVKRLRAVDHMSVEECFLLSYLYDHAATEIEALRNQLERVKRSALTLTSTQKEIYDHYQKASAINTEAVSTLDSEREANTLLTAEIEALRSREAELQTALDEADRKNDALTAEWNDTLRKLDEAVKALRPFAAHVDKRDEVITLQWGDSTYTGTLKPEQFYAASDALSSIRWGGEMTCCDSHGPYPEYTVGQCSECGGDVDKDGDSTEQSCFYSPSCPTCGWAPCDQSC